MDETNLRESTKSVEPRSADFSGETPRYPMDGNSNCTTWCRWETYRAFRNGQPGWDCRFIINATKTNPYPTYGQGKVHAGVKEHEEGTLEEKYIEIVAGETRTFYDQAVFVKAEAGADVPLNAYANILVPNVVSKGMNFTISVKRNLWYITYNANGGTGAPSTQKKHFNNTLYLSTQKPTKSGYTFTGWSTSSSSSYAQYQPGDAFTTDADTTLYAVWRQNQTTQYSLSFDLQGGTGTFNTLYGGYGERVQIPYTTPTKSGYTFKGWATYSGGSVSYQPGEYYTLYGNSTLYAVWQSSGGTTQYYLNFNLQGGSGTFNTLYGVYGERLFIPSSSPTKTGYTFQGWSTSSTGSPQYQPGDYYTIYSNTILYAIWGESTQYCTITFDANGGTGAPASQQKDVGEATYIPYAKPTRNGYTFLGWSTSKYTSTADYQPGQAYTPYGDMTFYAVWEQNVVKTWTITYNANGGENAPSPQTANVGQSIIITQDKPIRSGYTFLGWSTWNESPEPEAMFTPGYSYTSDSDTTLYAVWERVNTDPPSLYFPDTYGINLDFNYIPQLSIRANVTNPQDRTIYYKVCYVDNYYGDIHDYYLNSNGNTDTISQTTLNTQIPVTSTIIKKSIQNCNSETEFKLAICVSYENIFDNNVSGMKRYLVTVNINNYQKPIIKELYVGRTADGGAQLDTVFKYADSFTKITTGYTGVSVYIDDFIASSSEYTESNSFVGGAKNTINSLLAFINSAVSDYSHVFKIRVDDGIFYTEKTYILGVLRSDGNIYIYSDGRVEANGFVKLNSTDEDAILFQDGGFVYAKNFKKIANGVYLCPDVFEMFGRENTSMAYLLNQN